MSSPTPAQNRGASAAPSGSAPMSLTERRKAETRMEIARAAARLFVTQGLRATRAEDIAQAAGIAPRTFYRYFATKEEAVAPLYIMGAQRWAEAVREAPPELPLPEALEHAVRHTLTPGTAVSAASWEWVRTLVRLAMTSPALRKVWGEVCLASETSMAVVLGERGGVAGGDDNVAEGAVMSPELRYAAAVADAAVRVAVESWASGEAPATGPEGPAALALRNLAAVREFWGEG